MFRKIKSNLAEQQLTIKETLGYSFGQFAIGFGGMGTAVFLSFFWSDIALIPLGAIAVIMLLSRLFDAFNDVISAWLIDRTKSKYGKARAWLLYSTIPAMIVSIALFYTPKASVGLKILWAAIMYNLVNSFFSDFCLIPITSLTSLITSDPKGRITLNLSGQVAMVISQIAISLTFVAGITMFGGGSDGYFGYFGIVSLFTAVCMFLCFAWTEEKVKPIEQKTEKISFIKALKSVLTNKWWFLAISSQMFLFMLMTFLSVNIYYMTYIVKDLTVLTIFSSVMYIGQMAMPFVMAPLIKKSDPIKATIICLLISIIGFLLPLINLTSISILIISSILRGAGMSAMSSTRFAILGDVVDYGEWKTGDRSDALVFSGSSFSAKIGMALASFVITAILAAAKYVGGALTQVSSANTAIIFLFTGINALCVLGAIVCLYGLKGLSKKMPQIRKELEERRVAFSKSNLDNQ